MRTTNWLFALLLTATIFGPAFLVLAISAALLNYPLLALPFVVLMGWLASGVMVRGWKKVVQDVQSAIENYEMWVHRRDAYVRSFGSIVVTIYLWPIRFYRHLAYYW